MGRAFLHGQSSGGGGLTSLCYLDSDSSKVPGAETEAWFTWDGSSFGLDKESWTRIGHLVSIQHKKAIAYLNIRQSTSYGDIFIADMGEPVPALYFSTMACEAKLDIDSDGYVGVYLKLTQDSPWDALNIQHSTAYGAGNIRSMFMAPVD